jgi:hypothetical protein
MYWAKGIYIAWSNRLHVNPGPPGWGLDVRLETQFRKKTNFAMKSQSSIAGWIF